MKKNKGHLEKEALNAIDHLIEEISKAQDTIQALLDVALDLQDQLSNLIVLQVELVLPTEEEKLEAIAANQSLSSHESAGYMINIGSVSIYTMEGALKETFEKFETQAANIAGTYTSYAFSDTSLNELETVRNSITNLLVESMHGAESGSVRVPGALLLSEHGEKKEVKASSPIQEHIKEFTQYVKEFSVTIDGISTELITRVIMEAQKVIDRSALQNISAYAPATSELIDLEQNPAIYSIERLDYFNNFSEVEETISSALNTRILEVQKVIDRSALQNLSAYAPASFEITDIERNPAIYSNENLNYFNNFSEVVETISSSLNTRILEAQTTIDRSALQNLSASAPASFEITDIERNPAIYSNERFDYIKSFSEVAQTISSSLNTRILEMPNIADVSEFDKQSSRPSSAVLSKGEQRPVVYQGQKMVEIPAFKPREKVLVPSVYAAINTERLSDAIAINHTKKDASVLKDSIPYSMMPYSLSRYVSNAFETISDYVTKVDEINNQMSEMTEKNENTISKFTEPFNLLLAGNEANPEFSLERIDLGRNGNIAAEGQVVNLAQNIAAVEALHRAGSSAIKDVTLAMPPSGEVYSGHPATNVSRTIENVLQILSGSQGGNAAAPAGSNTINFHNTFNIAVNVKGGREENELRELGRKIGIILSEEIKRYGGIR